MLLRMENSVEYINQGIDKISFLVNPFFVNNNYNSPYTRYDPNKEVTIRKLGGWVVVEIHAEYFNFTMDIYYQLVNAMIQLINDEILLLPNNLLSYAFIYNNLDLLIYKLHEIEFFFDFKESDAFIDPKENDPNIPEEEKIFRDEKGTKYSKDRTRKNPHSVICIYDRQNKLLRVNQQKKSLIIKDPYRKRIEFRLTDKNCKYLNLDNLHGNYNEIFIRFMPYLASIYLRYVKNGVVIRYERYQNFKKLMKEVDKGRKRYRGKLITNNEHVTKKEIRTRLLKIKMNSNQGKQLKDSVKQHIRTSIHF